jgi:hypothetical protein
VAGGDLDVAQGDACLEGGSDERVAQGVAADGVLDAGPPCESVHDARRGVAVHAAPGAGAHQRPGGPLGGGEV